MRVLVACLLWCVCLAMVAPGLRAEPRPAPPSAERAEEDARVARAREHFLRGRALLDEGALDAALAEFLTSRKLFATKGNTQSAAYCLGQLGRFDEAMDLLEELLQRFSGLTAEERAAAEAELVRVRVRVGAIDLRGSEPGAAVVIDGRPRGTLPSAKPLRVPAGSRLVRVFKEGFAPFETRVEVAGGETVVVEAPLGALLRAGRLKVVEQSGRAVEVLLDNVSVGKTPWEGSVGAGRHQVRLQGEGSLGTQPVEVTVRQHQVTTVTLAVEPLEASLRVEPTPASAVVAIDGVVVGSGIWEGPLRVGAHRVEVAQEGFLPVTRDLTLARGSARRLVVRLERDPHAPMWRAARPQGVFAEAFGGGALGTGLGGDVVEGCGGACSRGLALGGLAVLRGGYQLPSGLGFGVEVGWAGIGQRLRDRGAVLEAVPSGNPRLEGTTADTLTLRGLLVGASAAYRTSGNFGATFRLAAGAWLGNLRDRRTGDFGGAPMQPTAAADAARYLYVLPEVRLSYAASARLDLSAALGALLMVGLAQPAWREDDVTLHPVLGYARFDEQTTAGAFLVFVTPGLAARWLF